MSSDDPARTFGSYAIAVTLIVTAGLYMFWPDEPERSTQQTEPPQEQPAPREQQAALDTVDVPEHKIVDMVDQTVGGLYGETIIPSLPVDVDTTRMKRIAFAIMEQHGLDEAAFYRTEEARRSDVSASFREGHPGALEEGLLGSVRNGDLTPSPYLYDPRFGGTR